MASDDDLLERTLAFSGSYVSDDGTVTVRRVAAATVRVLRTPIRRQLLGLLTRRPRSPHR